MDEFEINETFSHNHSAPNQRHKYSFIIPTDANHNYKVDNIRVNPPVPPPGVAYAGNTTAVLIYIENDLGYPGDYPFQIDLHNLPLQVPNPLFSLASIDADPTLGQHSIDVFVLEFGSVKGKKSVKYETADDEDPGGGIAD